jgi:HAD superfamily hydrolase (TIGR01509 family)
VFDMDGLLIDSETVYRDAMLETARAQGFHLPLSVIHRMVGLPWFSSVEVLLGHFGHDFDAEGFREDATRRFHVLTDAEVCLKAGVLEILDTLDGLGLKRAICTSSNRETVEHHIGHHGLLERFDAMVARGDAARPKPNPDPFLLAAERLGVAPADCLALEDSHNGIRAASSAGMMTIMVPDMLQATDEMQTLCVRIATDLHEVRDLIAATMAASA